MADDDDDLMKDVLGTSEADADQDEPWGLVVPLRAVNSIEQDLCECLYLEQQLATTVSIPFVEPENTDAERKRAAAEIMIAEIEQAPAAEKWGPLIQIARDLGPNGTLQQYEAACAELGVVPWPK